MRMNAAQRDDDGYGDMFNNESDNEEYNEESVTELASNFDEKLRMAEFNSKLAHSDDEDSEYGEDYEPYFHPSPQLRDDVTPEETPYKGATARTKRIFLDDSSSESAPASQMRHNTEDMNRNARQPPTLEDTYAPPRATKRPIRSLFGPNDDDIVQLTQGQPQQGRYRHLFERAPVKAPKFGQI